MLEKQTHRIAWAIAALLLIAGTAQAAIINVPTGTHPTIQAGIDAATSGVDEVVVAPGTYNEIIDFNDFPSKKC